jgi:hypothetical protein
LLDKGKSQLYKRDMNASQLLDKALTKIESQSMRDWVLKQRGIWEKIAQLYVDKKVYLGGNTPEDALHCDIVITAIG